MTNTLKWRLTKLPTVEELTLLVEKNIVTKEEAKKVLFNNETERDIESYKQEIKFLKEVIDKLGDREKIVTVVEKYIQPYLTQPFYQPYYFYVTSGTTNLTMNGTCGGAGGTTNARYTGATGSNIIDSSGDGTIGSGSTSCSFSSIVS